MTRLHEEIRSIRAHANVCADKAAKFTSQLEIQLGPNSNLSKDVELRRQELIAIRKELAKSGTKPSPEMLDTLNTIEHELDECRSMQPRAGGRFVEEFLGQVNLVIYSTDQRLRLRNNYLAFKKRTNMQYVVFPMILLCYSTSWTWGIVSGDTLDTLMHVWFLYYFVAMALRENVLRINGSHINRWWIWHHYLCIIVAGIGITFPKSAVYYSIRDPSNKYLMCQGIVQTLQTSYQKRRLYARRALGEVSNMDVPESDTLVHTSQTLWVLLPVLLGLQAAQFYVSLHLVYMTITGFHTLMRPELISTGLLAFFCVLLASGNIYITATTLWKKRFEKQK